jgi:hypothetical protein
VSCFFLAKNKKGREINGIVLLDKDTGLSSNAALQKVKRLFFAKKAGHTGALELLALTAHAQNNAYYHSAKILQPWWLVLNKSDLLI